MPGATRRTFGYDGLHRLTSDTLTAAGGATVASVGYGYDPDGNLTSKTTTGFAGAGDQHLQLRPGGPADLLGQRQHHDRLRLRRGREPGPRRADHLHATTRATS